MSQKIFNVFIFFAVCGLWAFQLIDYSKEEELPPIEEVKEEVITITPEFLTAELSDSLLLKALDFYDVQYPHIVYAQAILETGHFRSKVCKNYNNLFGLYNSYTNEYFKFDHWSESVLAYMEYVQRKYNPHECYYTFLKELPYAMDPLYINKVKQLVKEHENISIR